MGIFKGCLARANQRELFSFARFKMEIDLGSVSSQTGNAVLELDSGKVLKVLVKCAFYFL
jgi:hypothetical protein